jgi:hypothetical protein
MIVPVRSPVRNGGVTSSPLRKCGSRKHENAKKRVSPQTSGAWGTTKCRSRRGGSAEKELCQEECGSWMGRLLQDDVEGVKLARKIEEDTEHDVQDETGSGALLEKDGEWRKKDGENDEHEFAGGGAVAHGVVLRSELRSWWISRFYFALVHKRIANDFGGLWTESA